MITNLKIFIVASFVLISHANASLEGTFDELNKVSKGAFGLNYLQGKSSRTTIQSGNHPSGLLFQAAYRNELARELEQKYDFYTGNLFTTNYYELMGQYVYGDAYSNHDLDHGKLINNASQAMPRANIMVKNWVLEKFYTTQYPNTRLARGFSRRGIAGSEYEQKFAVYFFNFYLSSISDDYQYLPGFLLAKSSPIVDSKALARARNLIAESYDYFVQIYPSSSNELKGLWMIRNAIHNQISEDVIPMISKYLSNNPWYEAEGNTYLQKIKVLLTEYYAFNPSDIAALATKASQKTIATAAQKISSEGVNDNNLLSLSYEVAKLKKDITKNGTVSSSKKAESLALLVKSCDFLNKEINRMSSVNTTAALLTLLNIIYTEGFLIEDNWLYFNEEMKAVSVNEAKQLMVIVIEIGTDTLVESFSTTYKQWLSVAPDSGMEKFIDNTIKSSSLNTASVSLIK